MLIFKTVFSLNLLIAFMPIKKECITLFKLYFSLITVLKRMVPSVHERRSRVFVVDFEQIFIHWRKLSSREIMFQVIALIKEV